MNSTYSTKCTRVGRGWYCLVLYKDKPVVQTFVKERTDIGPAFRNLLRTFDKCGGDEFTYAARHREGRTLCVKHEWL